MSYAVASEAKFIDVPQIAQRVRITPSGSGNSLKFPTQVRNFSTARTALGLSNCIGSAMLAADARALNSSWNSRQQNRLRARSVSSNFDGFQRLP